MAARIPTFADLGFNDPRAATGDVRYPASDPGAAALATVGKGLQQAGVAALKIGNEQEDKRQKLNEGVADIDFLNRFVPLHTSISLETDPARIAEKRKEYDTLLATSGNAIDDPVRQAEWRQKHTRTILQAHADADKRLTGLDRDRVSTSLQEQVDTAARTAGSTPEALGASTIAIDEALKWGQEYGALSPEHAYALKKRALSQGVRGAASTLVERGKYDEAAGLLDKHEADIDPTVATALRHRIGVEREKQGAKRLEDSLWGGSDKGFAGARSGDLADRIVGAESGGRADAKNPRSTATGPGQFIDSTWLSMVKAEAPEVAQGKSNSDILALRSDRDLSRRMTEAYSENNKKFLSGKGLPTDDGALYLAHFLGPAGAEKVLTSDPGTPIRNLFSADVLKANPNIANATAGDVRQLTARRVGAEVPTGEPSPRATPQFDGGTSPLPNIDAMTARAQEMADRGEVTQEQANRAMAGIRARYNHLQAAQANDRAALAKRLSNGAAQLEDGREFDYDPAEIRHYFPKEKADEIIGQLDDARDGGQIVGGIRTASPDQLAQQRAQLAAGLNDPNAPNYAKRRRMVKLFDEASDARDKMLIGPHADPAGYVAKYSPNVAGKFAAIDPRKPETFGDYATAALAEQERLGVPSEGRSILPAGIAAQTAARIAGLDPAKVNPGAALSDLAKSYGEHWPQVFGDLVKAKLPGTYQVLATMDHPKQGVAASDLSQAIGLVAEKGGMSALKKAVPDETQKEIDKGLDDNLAEFRESVGNQGGGARLYATVRDAVQALAYYHGFRGKSPSEAARAAVDGIINEKYDFGRIAGATVRVPKGELATVEKATDAVRASIKPEDLGPVPGNPLLTPEQRKDIWLGAIRSGSWVNNEDDSGVVLTGLFRDGARSVVRRADGSRIEVKFNNAATLAAGARTVTPMVPDAADAAMRALQ